MVADHDDARRAVADEVRILAPNMNHRFSGVTASIIAVTPPLDELYATRAIGSRLPPGVPAISWSELLRLGRDGRLRVWHARRNVEMLAGLLLRGVLRHRLILVFTSAAQREHSGLTRWLYTQMDRVVAPTPAAASFLEVPAVVVPHGVDTRAFHPTEDRTALWRALGGPGDHGIGVFGRVRPGKGTEELIDAACATLPDFPGWGLVVIGEATPKHRGFARMLRDRVRDAGLDDRIRFVGRIDDFREIPAWYRATSLVVAPPRVEGFGLTCLEAMASGCPVIATRTGAFEQIVEPGRTGWLVPCGDAGALAGALRDALSDPDELIAAGLRARRRVEADFPIEGEARSLAAVYDDLFARFGGRA